MTDKAIEKVSTDAFLQSDRLNQMMKVAQQFHKAGCFMGDVKNPEQAFVKIQAGAEMGMPPMEAMNSLYIVNGKITIWGSAMSKKLREAGWKISFDDKVDAQGKPTGCTVTIKKDDEELSETATAQQLVALKSRAFSFAPKEKLRWHAIAQLVKFHVPEVLGGVVMYMKEEIEDLPRERAEVTVVDDTEIPQADDVVKELNECEDVKTFKEIEERLPKIINDYSEEERKEIAKAFRAKRDELIEKVAEDVKPVEMMDDHGVIVDGEKISTKDIDLDNEKAVDAELDKVAKQAGKDRERGELPNPKKND